MEAIRLAPPVLLVTCAPRLLHLRRFSALLALIVILDPPLAPLVLLDMPVHLLRGLVLIRHAVLARSALVVKAAVLNVLQAMHAVVLLLL